jgi:two-component sensor histidine kinase
MEYRIVRDGEVRWIESRSFISYDDEGRARRVIGVNIDVTARKRAEEQQGVLIAELDHRVKNTLATVCAVAAQTLDASSSMADFVTSLDGRLRSMARTHELLSHRKWRGIPLTDLINRELAPYVRGNNAQIAGPDVMLTAEAGQSVGMALHELVTNAAKYGALSTRQGRVSVRWHQPKKGGLHDRLIIEWLETGGPPVRSSPKSGYGTGVITDLLPYELGGSADLVFAPDGVQCRLEIPANWLAAGNLGAKLNGSSLPTPQMQREL